MQAQARFKGELIILRQSGGAPRASPPISGCVTQNDKVLSRKLLQYLFAQLLRLAEKLLVLHKQPIQFERSVGVQFLAQNHIPHMYGVRQRCILVQFFQGGVRIVVVHQDIVLLDSPSTVHCQQINSSGQEWPLHTPHKVKSPTLSQTPRQGWGIRSYSELATENCSYVPSLQPARYSSCSGVSLSILMLIDSSFNLATRLSSSSGTL